MHNSPGFKGIMPTTVVFTCLNSPRSMNGLESMEIQDRNIDTMGMKGLCAIYEIYKQPFRISDTEVGDQ